VRSAGELRPGEAVLLQLANGEADAEVLRVRCQQPAPGQPSPIRQSRACPAGKTGA
jgi:hypothetical protein